MFTSGSQEKFEQLNNKARSSQEGPKVRFDGLEETESERFNVRRLRGRNIFQNNDEVASVASVLSDNTHLYRRSRSAVSPTQLSLSLKTQINLHLFSTRWTTRAPRNISSSRKEKLWMMCRVR